MSVSFPKTTLEIYRDCLRLVRHVAPGQSPKGMALRHTVRQQFKQYKDETNPAQIEMLRANAVRGLSNYMLFQSAQSDDRLKKAMKDQVANAKKGAAKGNEGMKKRDDD